MITVGKYEINPLQVCYYYVEHAPGINVEDRYALHIYFNGGLLDVVGKAEETSQWCQDIADAISDHIEFAEVVDAITKLEQISDAAHR
jgi:hypothetical protein